MIKGDYINSLNKYMKLDNTASEKKSIKEHCISNFIISPSNIEKSFFENQKLKKDSKKDNIVLYDEETKYKMINELINDQIKSLNMWFNYFDSEKCTLPSWTKYWVITGILNLGKFNNEENKYEIRNENTIEAFEEIDKEIISKCYDYIISIFGKKDFNENEIELLVKNNSFKKIYEHLKINKENNKSTILNTTIGKWLLYDDKTQADKLVESLENKSTGWSIVGKEEAKLVLEQCNINIFYTMDEKGNFTNPRLLIESRDNNIIDIKGISYQNSIEDSILWIVEQAIMPYNNYREYLEKCKNLKKIQTLYNKFNKDEEITDEDTQFIKEIIDENNTFSDKEAIDPRIGEIIEVMMIDIDLLANKMAKTNIR